MFFKKKELINSVYTYTGKDNANNNKNYGMKKYLKKMVNLELKAHNPAEVNISKDIEKIIREDTDGNWFHILKNIYKDTLPKLFNKLIKSFKKYDGEGTDKSILFCICILEKKWGMMKNLQYKPSSGKNITNLMEEFFCLSKINNSNNIKDKNLQEQKDILINNGWTIIEH